MTHTHILMHLALMYVTRMQQIERKLKQQPSLQKQQSELCNMKMNVCVCACISRNHTETDRQTENTLKHSVISVSLSLILTTIVFCSRQRIECNGMSHGASLRFRCCAGALIMKSDVGGVLELIRNAAWCGQAEYLYEYAETSKPRICNFDLPPEENADLVNQQINDE